MGNHKGLPLRAVRRGNPLWLPLAVKYLFICASVLIKEMTKAQIVTVQSIEKPYHAKKFKPTQ